MSCLRRSPVPAIVEGVRPGHDMDRVDEELGSDARFALVLAEAEQAESGNHDDGRVRIAERGRIWPRVSIVVRAVVPAIPYEAFSETTLEIRNLLGRRVPLHVEWTDPCAQEMIRAAGAETAQLLGPLGACELDGVFAPFEVRDHAAVRRDGAAEHRQEQAHDGVSICGLGRPETAKPYGVGATLVITDEFPHLIDRFDAVQITVALSVPPRE